MLKKALLTIVAVAILVGGLYQFGGVRLARDGSGMWPRFFSADANYEALEADRARQRGQALTPASEAAVPPQPSLASAQAAPQVAVESAGAPAAATMARGYWPDFRGPNHDGRYDEAPIRSSWPSEGLRPMWKQPIGLGYASFVVADGRAFTIEQRRSQEVVSAYDVDTGRELWTNAWDGEFIEGMGGDGPRATPTYHDGRIYALGALGEFRSLNAATGAMVWRRNILDEAGASNLTWGMAASPLIVDNAVIVLPGGPRGKSVAAYDRLTGAPLWTSLDDPQAYTSPMLVTLGGVRQLLIVSATRMMGITVDGGRLLWEYPWVTEYGINATQPLLLGNDRVFISAAYGHGAAVIEVARKGDGFSTRTVWQNIRMKNKFSSSVLHQGSIYGLDEAILACVDAATGEQRWKGGRYGYGQILLAGDHIIVLTEDGDVAIVRATPERHDEMVRFAAIEGKTWNYPVVAGGRLLVRNLREMAAFDIRP